MDRVFTSTESDRLKQNADEYIEKNYDLTRDNLVSEIEKAIIDYGFSAVVDYPNGRIYTEGFSSADNVEVFKDEIRDGSLSLNNYPEFKNLIEEEIAWEFGEPLKIEDVPEEDLEDIIINISYYDVEELKEYREWVEPSFWVGDTYVVQELWEYLR